MQRNFPANSLVVFILLVALASSSFQQQETSSVTVYSKNNYILNSEDYLKGAAVARLVDSVQLNGWSQLNISTNANLFNDEEQMYAAGMAEGLISSYQTWQLLQNQIYDWNFTESTGSVKRTPSSNYVYPKGIINFLTQNNAWMRKEAIQRKDHCKFWYHVNLMMTQFDGLVDGFLIGQQRDSRIPANKYLDWFDLLVLQAAGDMYTLVDAFGSSLMKSSLKTRAEAFASGIPLEVFQSNAFTRKYKEEPPYTECSALIKVTPDCKNIFVGHTTWRRYNIINKFFKTLTMPLKFVAAKTVSMSSSASFFSSKEDYLAMDSGLVALETSLSTYNTSLYKLLKPESLLSWVRSVVASRLAYTSKEWIDTFAKFSSGTYNNQWMSLDMKKFKPGTCQLEKDTLWIIEELPGGANQNADVSSIVNSNQGYWPSYNIPYFPEIYNMLGYAEAKKKFGNEMDYKLCPRAKIFAREQAKIINDWKSFGRVLQFNEWQIDEFSEGDPAKSIAARYDLRPTNGQLKPAAFGGADTKLTSYRHVMNSATGKPVTFGMAGPTHQEQAPFTWNDNRWNSIPHLGQPDTYDFDWVQFNN